MNREKVIVILHYYRDADKAIKMNERVIKNLEDQYYSTLGAVNSDGMPHGKGFLLTPLREGRPAAEAITSRIPPYFYSRPCGRGDF